GDKDMIVKSFLCSLWLKISEKILDQRYCRYRCGLGAKHARPYGDYVKSGRSRTGKLLFAPTPFRTDYDGDRSDLLAAELMRQTFQRLSAALGKKENRSLGG